MFTGELAESRQTEVTIRDIDETAMELLIDFCYTSNITVEESNVQTLLPAACLLHLAEIQDVCCEFLKRQLDPSNCLGIRAFADTHACRDLLRSADKFTQNNFQEVLFKRLSSYHLIRLIKSGMRSFRVQELAAPTVMVIVHNWRILRDLRLFHPSWFQCSVVSLSSVLLFWLSQIKTFWYLILQVRFCCQLLLILLILIVVLMFV